MTETHSSDPAALAEAIRAAADLAESELDLQIKVEKLLDPFLPKIPGAPEHYGHATKLGGIEDALHGNVIIEYERPGKLSKPAGLDECLQQLRDYLTQEAHRHGRQATAALKRMVGIGLDGREIVFVRYRGKDAAPYLPPAKVSPQLAFFPESEVRDFYRDGPHPITVESVGTLLGYLHSLARLPLTPEALDRKLAERFVGSFRRRDVPPGAARRGRGPALVLVSHARGR